ncbi:MAG: TolC family protein [Bdellovibrionales bacterium]|nr:TolC family protein [Bdellovibrionales bacterium]
MVSAKAVCIALVTLSLPLAAEEVLRPQNVVDAVLAKSYDAAEIALRAQSGYVSMEKALGNFDLKIRAKAGYEYDESEALTGLTNPIDKTLTSEMSFEKATSFGSTFEILYRHEAQASTLNPIIAAASTRAPTAALDTAYIQWRQNLWGNFFGYADRLDLSVARGELKQSDLKKQEETEDLVLKSLRFFWDAYVAQTQLQDAITARTQYKNLIGVVQRRGRFGLDKGGEYAQVMADFTDADNKVKTASYEYLNKLKELEILMQTNFAADVKFEPGELVPPLPKLGPVETEKLRRLQVAQTAFENSKAHERSVDSRNSPGLDIIARAASTGVDEKAGTSYSEFVSGNKPTYFVGVEFTTAFDSSERRAAMAEARVRAGTEGTALNRVRSDVTKNLALLDQRLAEAFAVANGSIEAEKYRSRTVREQEVEYRQGRLPLRDLLQTYRLFFDSQSKKVRAIGDYHIALNEMAAERDELVK